MRRPDGLPMPPRQGGRSPVVPHSEAISARGAEWRALFVGAREWALFGAAQAVPLGGARARGLAADIPMFCRSDVVGNRHAYRSLAHAGHTLGRLGSSGSTTSPPEPFRADFSGQRSELRPPNALYLPPRGRPRGGRPIERSFGGPPSRAAGETAFGATALPKVGRYNGVSTPGEFADPAC